MGLRVISYDDWRLCTGNHQEENGDDSSCKEEEDLKVGSNQYLLTVLDGMGALQDLSRLFIGDPYAQPRPFYFSALGEYGNTFQTIVQAPDP